ncbi:MAG: DUF2062 domain-containing protein [Limisphaerales bacterium]
MAVERWLLFHLIRLFRIRGRSERVARGFALGLIVNFLPTFGFGVVISGALARLFGGNAVAGVVGGALLTFAWPVLFYLNLRVGSLLVAAPVPIDDIDEVTGKHFEALLWGRTFTAGAVINCLLFGLISYAVLRLVYRQIRPGALTYFRRHARDHQRRFRRPR